jgi:hypothetical protein
MENVKQLIKDLGGPTKVAKQLGTTPQNVVVMYQTQIPWKYRRTIEQLASGVAELPGDFWE